MSESGTCRYCGRELVKDDEALTVAHEAPVCAGFQARVKGKVEIKTVQPADLEAHFADMRQRVRARRS
jgi:hypothetical protein